MVRGTNSSPLGSDVDECTNSRDHSQWHINQGSDDRVYREPGTRFVHDMIELLKQRIQVGMRSNGFSGLLFVFQPFTVSGEGSAAGGGERAVEEVDEGVFEDGVLSYEVGNGGTLRQDEDKGRERGGAAAVGEGKQGELGQIGQEEDSGSDAGADGGDAGHLDPERAPEGLVCEEMVDALRVWGRESWLV